VELSTNHPLNSGQTAGSRLIQNMRGQRTESLPVWFMRQAGRSLPEYRAIRAETSMLESCLTPDLVAEITMQPVRRHKVDAAIFFSDIVVPFKLAGIDVDIKAGVGPVVSAPVRTREDLSRLGSVSSADFSKIVEAVQLLVAELGETPLIGFGGAPFTLASYLVEGGPSKDLPVSRSLMKSDPELWSEILGWCADITAGFISAQVAAGASALQVFDSWAGKLTPSEYREFAMPSSVRLFDQLRHLVDANSVAVPRVHFGVGTSGILQDMFDAGATVMGIDSETDLAQANLDFGGQVPLQGNLSTDCLEEPWTEIERQVRSVISAGSQAPGHIFNLGHGVPKDTKPEVLTDIVELVHSILA